MGGFVANREALLEHGEHSARSAALDIVEGSIERVQPERLIENRMRRDGTTIAVDGERYDLDTADAVHLVAAGKGARRLAAAVLAVLGDAVDGGVVVEKRGQGGPVDHDGVRVLEAGHPVPDADSVAAGEAVLEFVGGAGPDDLVICCITGGASALLCVPADGLALEDLEAVTHDLLAAGAPIEDLNAVRKHLSAIKGGRLARRIAPARAVTLVIVDEVAGEPWGPTVPDPTTAADAVDTLRRHELSASAPDRVRDHLRRGRDNLTLETPDADALADVRSQVVVLADASDLSEAASAAANDAGFEPLVLSTTIEGESREVGTVLAGIAREVREHGCPVSPPCAVISGGETTVTVDDPAGAGDGGPNQELALSAARRLDGLEGVALAAVDSDGTDGPTALAGGIVDGSTVGRAEAAAVGVNEGLASHDAAATLEALDDAVRLRETGTNLMDLRVLVVLDGAE